MEEFHTIKFDDSLPEPGDIHIVKRGPCYDIRIHKHDDEAIRKKLLKPNYRLNFASGVVKVASGYAKNTYKTDKDEGTLSFIPNGRVQSIVEMIEDRVTSTFLNKVIENKIISKSFFQNAFNSCIQKDVMKCAMSQDTTIIFDHDGTRLHPFDLYSLKSPLDVHILFEASLVWFMGFESKYPKIGIRWEIRQVKLANAGNWHICIKHLYTEEDESDNEEDVKETTTSELTTSKTTSKVNSLLDAYSSDEESANVKNTLKILKPPTKLVKMKTGKPRTFSLLDAYSDDEVNPSSKERRQNGHPVVRPIVPQTNKVSTLLDPYSDEGDVNQVANVKKKVVKKMKKSELKAYLEAKAAKKTAE